MKQELVEAYQQLQNNSMFGIHCLDNEQGFWQLRLNCNSQPISEWVSENEMILILKACAKWAECNNKVVQAESPAWIGRTKSDESVFGK